MLVSKIKPFTLVVIFTSLFSHAKAQDFIPSLNAQIITYVKSVMGTQVDRGECWDIANRALILINAKWDREFKYGRLLNPQSDIIYPGDIIQFKNVKLKYTKDDATYIETMAQHTAIVYRVISKGVYELAHQNTSFSGRKVGTSIIDINTVVKGKLFIYRPVTE
jgi:hypothetical protein